MTAPGWQRIHEAFATAVATDPGERQEHLDRLRAEDPGLAAEVESLLAADADAGGFLETPPPVPAALLAGPSAGLAAGDLVGPYRVLRELGQGGMGGVYLAERADGQYSQRVAIKVLRPGLESGDAAGRFLGERQILASLKHPGVARLLDGGTAPDGKPYLVMEYIEGVPITAYCEERGLSVAKRLPVFIQVCRAVGYAHRNLLVHRDIKAANILVTEGGQPKLLDFGIAKLLDDAEPKHDAPRTRTGHHLMTPACASPEQVRGDPVTTASDVYQLGLLLYEMLAGGPPYRVDSRSPGEIERIVCETRPDPLPEGVPADLKVIVSKALRKEPERRYGSADQLADDLERFLAGRPISARADTWRYRTSRFLRRNRGAVAGAAAGAVLLIVLAAVSLRFAVTTAEQSRAIAAESERARAGEARAQRVTEFMVRLFESALPSAGRRDTLTVRAVLGEAGGRIDAELSSEPAVQATLLNAVGRIQHGLGALEEGHALVARALAMRRDLYRDAPHPDLVESLYQAAQFRLRAYHLPIADSLFREALAVHRALPRSDSLRTATLLQGWAMTVRNLGRADTAVALMREVVSLRAALQGTGHRDYLVAIAALAYSLRGLGELDEADALYREAVAGQRALGEDGRRDLPETLNNYASVLLDSKRYDAAAALYREAADIHEDLYGEAHFTTLAYRSGLRGALTLAGRFDDAVLVARESLRRAAGAYPDPSWELGSAHARLGFVLFAKRDYSAAAAASRIALRMFAADLGRDHIWTATAEHHVGSALELAGRTGEARRHLDRSLVVLEGDPLRASTLISPANLEVLVDHLRRRGDTALAERYEAFLDLRV